MRTDYHDKLDALSGALATMCGVAGDAMERATKALLDTDLAEAEQVITEHDRLTRMQTEAEEAAFSLLALQAPVAGELRTVISVMQSVADAERMGGLALHVAKLVRLRHPAAVVPEQTQADFAEMGRIAVDLAQAAQAVVRSADPERAARIREDDDAMDRMHRHLFTLLLDRSWEHGVAAAVDVTLLGRFYERFADHAVEIGRRVVFQATGQQLTDD